MERHQGALLTDEVVLETRPAALHKLVDLLPEARMLDAQSKEQNHLGAALAILNFIANLPQEVKEHFRKSRQKVTLTTWGLNFTDTYIGYYEDKSYGGFGVVKTSLVDNNRLSGLLTPEDITSGWNRRYGHVSRQSIIRLARCRQERVIKKILNSI